MRDTDNLEKKPKALRRAQDLTTADRAAIIRQLEFGSGLSDRTVSQFAESSLLLDVRRRRFVYRAGDQADALYAIVKGRIKLCRLEPQTDREAVIDILPEGSSSVNRRFTPGRDAAKTAPLPTKMGCS